MAEINNAIALQAQAPAFNPLETIGNVSKVQQLLLNNKLLQQQYGSKISGGRALGASIDPATGLPDQAKVGQYYVDHPDEAQYGAEALSQAQQLHSGQLGNQKTQTELSKDQLALSQQRWGAATGVMDGLLSAKQPLTRDDVIGAVKTQMVPLGHFNDPESMNQVIQFAQGIPAPTGNPQVDNANIRAYLTQQSIRSNNALEHINMLMGAPQNVESGPAIINQQVSPLTGAVQINGAIQKGLSPGEAITPNYTVTSPEGVPGIVTKGATAAAGPGGTPAVIPTGPAAGTVESLVDTAQEGVKQANDLTRQARLVPDRRAALSNLTQALKGFTPGPKADLTYQLGALATQFNLPVPKVATGVAAQEEFNKLASQIALAQFSSLGGTGANEQLAATMKANPNQVMSKMGIKNVAALLQGNNDAIDAMNQAWQKYAAVNGKGSYQDFTTDWNKIYDPRVFQYMYMDPSAQRTLIDSLGGKWDPKTKTWGGERGRFERSARIAEQLGWLRP